jgi:hypothetical protein
MPQKHIRTSSSSSYPLLFNTFSAHIPSGFFLDYQGAPAYHSGMTWAFYQQNSTSGVNDACIAAHPGTESQCMFAEHTAPHIQTPIFPLQSAYDSWQVPRATCSWRTWIFFSFSVIFSCDLRILNLRLPMILEPTMWAW